MVLVLVVCIVIFFGMEIGVGYGLNLVWEFSMWMKFLCSYLCCENL